MVGFFLRLDLGFGHELDLESVLKSTVVTPKIIDILGLKQPIEAGAQGGRTSLRNLQRQVDEAGLIGAVLIPTELALDLRLELALERETRPNIPFHRFRFFEDLGSFIGLDGDFR